MLKYFLIIIIIFSLAACSQANSNDQSSKQVDIMPSLTKEQKMDTAFFWKIMDHAFAKAKFNNELKAQTILDQLTKLTPEQIQVFEAIFQQISQKANTWNILAANTIIAGGASDDGFFYFRCWLISLGKYHFEETLKNPDHLADIDFPINRQYGYGEVEFEDLIPLSDNAYEIVTKRDPAKDSTFPRALAQRKGLFFDSGGKIQGTEWTDKDLPKIVPKLCKKFNIK